MDVAHQLLADRGFSAFSYADIAEAVQIRKASIHHHFPTKAALVVAVLERHRKKNEGGYGCIRPACFIPTRPLETVRGSLGSLHSQRQRAFLYCGVVRS